MKSAAIVMHARPEPMHEHHPECRQRISVAAGWLTMACAVLLNGYGAMAQADRAHGLVAFHAADYGLALTELGPAATAGDAEAQYTLGVMYAQGWGTLADPVRAADWYQRAAKQGFAKAEHNLAALYLSGSGVIADSHQARVWFERAAQHGSAKSAHLLGLLYFKGDGVSRDYVAALEWWQRALNGHEPDAGYNLGILYRRGLGVDQNLATAAKYWQRAAANGSLLGQNALGMAYERGEGVPRDVVKALGWYELAARHGLAIAAQNAEVLKGSVSARARAGATFCGQSSNGKRSALGFAEKLIRKKVRPRARRCRRT